VILNQAFMNEALDIVY